MGVKKFETGAVRSTDAESVRYDLISPIALRRLAETCAEGARKYGEGNWLKGIPGSDLFNHAVRHLYLWLNGDRSEDHLAHAAWNLFAIMHFEETRPDLIDSVFQQKNSDKEVEQEKEQKPDKVVFGPSYQFKI